MIANPDEGKYIVTKKGLFLRLQDKIKASKGCCNDWKECIFHSECLLSQVLWSPIRSNLSQNNLGLGVLVTLDCFFSPPNLLSIGLVIDIRSDIVFIYYWQGQVVVLKKEHLFVFPDTELLSSFEYAIKKAYRESAHFKEVKENRKYF